MGGLAPLVVPVTGATTWCKERGRKRGTKRRRRRRRLLFQGVCGTDVDGFLRSMHSVTL